MRLLLAVVIVALPASSRAQSASDAPFATAQGGFFALSVRDLAASVAWYTEKLGLRSVMTVPRTGKIAGVAALEGNGLLVELLQHDDAVARNGASPELTRGIAKAGVIVTDFDRTVAALRARGVEITSGPYPPRPAMRANLMFRDNEGNTIQVLGPYAPR